ncbi:Oligosaccharide biosynthesis protein Alg14 like [Sinosporangium album]|uniref:Oligosaccharide biosynthesis protein Alg14 like n=1 Tax=Sinosporangium album TaxID=504805 RepID=A0A1G7UCG9_9ACTN|nr:PssD/Cps14F family polysaccharide biosynthesis glycosyltransferase [Sinosporangium album]SDG45282.1 Oligosaccharide biosynthesis protein Alg14 like [Sinosporangium album]
MKVLFVCSGGGHLGQLYRLRSWWQGEQRHWVTFRQADAVSLLAEEKVTWAYHPTTRNIPNLLRNLMLAFRLLPRYKPDVIVSSGAGVAYPFFLLAKLYGCRTVYLEVYDRIDSGTLTGKLCYPLSDLFLLQWPEQREAYPKGVVVGQVM